MGMVTEGDAPSSLELNAVLRAMERGEEKTQHSSLRAAIQAAIPAQQSSEGCAIVSWTVMGIKHTVRVKRVVKHLGEAVLKWGFGAYREKMLYIFGRFALYRCYFLWGGGVDGLEIGTGSMSLCVYIYLYLFNPGVQLFLASLHAGLLPVLGLNLMLCLSFPA